MFNVTVKVTPQNTADVYIGGLHIKTFGGVHAHQAAADFAQAIQNELKAEPEPQETQASVPTVTPEVKDNQDAKTNYKYSRRN